MATQRFNYNDKFNLKDQKVGIVSTTPEESLDVTSGTLKGVDLQSNSGVTTFSTYQGFQNKKTSYTGNVQIETGESGTLSGEIVIGSGTTLSVGTGATTGQGSIKSLKVSNTFTPPIGGTADRPSAPQPGAIFYNKDFRTIEYWDGNFWRQVDNVTRSGRQVSGSGNSGTNNTEFGTFNAHTLGNEVHFGTLSSGRVSYGGGSGNSIRGLFTGGYNYSNVIDYFTIQSGGQALDFGDSREISFGNSSLSSSTRSVTFCGYTTPGGGVNTIDYVEIMTTGNALDFGDSGNTVWSATRGSSPTRGINGSVGNRPFFQYITIASKGDAIDFTERVSDESQNTGCSNSVRMLISSGLESTPNFKRISYLSIPTLGENISFGDLTVGRQGVGSNATNTRAVFSGGNLSSASYNIIEYVTIQTLGNAKDFGDLMDTRRNVAQVSDSHGGLGGF